MVDPPNKLDQSKLDENEEVNGYRPVEEAAETAEAAEAEAEAAEAAAAAAAEAAEEEAAQQNKTNAGLIPFRPV